jgi:hypothetical protein
MSILDRVTKVVGDVVDRGKKEVDQFVRIQKINSQISDLEKRIAESKGVIQQAKIKLGEMAIEMLQAGTLVSPPMKELLDQINEVLQQQIAPREAEIAQKRTEIESIRAEDKSQASPAPIVETPSAPPPAQQRVCPQCGTAASSGAFCQQCGAKLT